jgi:hypothetical protein
LPPRPARRPGRLALTALSLTITFLLVISALYAQEVPNSEPAKAGESKPASQPAAPAQPFPFSHKIHARYQLPCRFCHPNPDPGNEMTIPDLAKCMSCHTEVAKDKPSIMKLAQVAKDRKSLTWVRVYAVPAFVYWSHRTHLEAKVKCEMCHGIVSEMEVMEKVTNVTTMGGCVDCHKRNEASTGCVACHEGQGSQLRLGTGSETSQQDAATRMNQPGKKIKRDDGRE